MARFNHVVDGAHFNTCSAPGCPHMAGPSGFCRNHQANYKNDRTSDGVNTRPKRKLSPEQVVEARQMRSAFKSNREIAQHFGVTLTTLRAYLNGERA